MGELREKNSVLISDKVKALEAERIVNLSLRVAVLGPGLQDATDPGSLKREQIREALEQDGHRPFFPEHELSIIAATPFVSHLELERLHLRKPDVHLVIVLYTSRSPGAAMELGNFLSDPEIKAKTAVLYPIEYYTPNESLVANAVRSFLVKMPYSSDHFKSCQIVGECRIWAHARSTGLWPVVAPHVF